MLGSNAKCCLRPSRDGRRHLHSAESKHPANAWPAASSYASARFATTNCEESLGEKYSLNISWLMEMSMPPQIWPHLPVLVLRSLLRYAAPVI